MTQKLKLTREPVRKPATSPEPSSLRFPDRAVRSLPTVANPRWRQGAQETPMPSPDSGTLRHPELVRQIEATLDRMQSGLDSLKTQVDSYKFPVADDDEEHPWAA